VENLALHGADFIISTGFVAVWGLELHPVFSFGRRSLHRAVVTAGHGEKELKVDLKRFPTAELAAQAYREVANKHYGEFASY
jgi:hypothetical protein